MKINRFLCLLILSIFLFGACKVSTSSNPDNSNNNSQQQQEKPNQENPDPEEPENPEPPVPENTIISNSYFWGNWTRMDNGENYNFGESQISYNNETYKIIDSTETSLTVETLGTFIKESASVIKNDNIPFFRLGGSNLEYKLTLVGLEKTLKNARAAGSTVGIKAKGKSNTYKSFTSETESDDNGVITLTAPTVNDIQTVTIQNESEMIVVPGLKIENNNSNMGTVALVEKGLWNFKITGVIDESEKDDGYLFGNNYKEYKMKITITNIGDSNSNTSILSISSDNPNLSVISKDSNLDLSGTMLTPINPGYGTSFTVAIQYGVLTDPYVETGLNITIENLQVDRKYIWNDYIPLKFHKGLIPATIAAHATSGNGSKSLNGFFIYPDGNSKYFSVKHDEYKTLFVPTFGYDKNFILSFSGARTDGSMTDSGEMFYTCALGSTKEKEIVYSGTALSYYYNYAEPNNQEDEAFEMESEFEAYLHSGDIDFFSISADSPSFYLPSGKYYYAIRYENMFGNTPETITVENGTILNSTHLPTLTKNGYVFCGWYIKDTQTAASGQKVNDNLTLVAKWSAVNVPSISIQNDSDIKINYTYSNEYDSINEKTKTYLKLSVDSSKSANTNYCWYVDGKTSNQYTNKSTISIDISEWIDIVHEIYVYSQEPERSATIFVTLPKENAN